MMLSNVSTTNVHPTIKATELTPQPTTAAATAITPPSSAESSGISSSAGSHSPTDQSLVFRSTDDLKIMTDTKDWYPNAAPSNHIKSTADVNNLPSPSSFQDGSVLTTPTTNATFHTRTCSTPNIHYTFDSSTSAAAGHHYYGLTSQTQQHLRRFGYGPLPHPHHHPQSHYNNNQMPHQDARMPFVNGAYGFTHEQQAQYLYALYHQQLQSQAKEDQQSHSQRMMMMMYGSSGNTSNALFPQDSLMYYTTTAAAMAAHGRQPSVDGSSKTTTSATSSPLAGETGDAAIPASNPSPSSGSTSSSSSGISTPPNSGSMSCTSSPSVMGPTLSFNTPKDGQLNATMYHHQQYHQHPQFYTTTPSSSSHVNYGAGRASSGFNTAYSPHPHFGLSPHHAMAAAAAHHHLATLGASSSSTSSQLATGSATGPSSIKICSNCGCTSTPSWRRCPTGKQLLCNACGLYQKLHNKPRPFCVLDDGSVKVQRNAFLEATRCGHCNTTETPLWRRGSNGQSLCNACGLYFKQHRQYRPSLPNTGWLATGGYDAEILGASPTAPPSIAPWVNNTAVSNNNEGSGSELLLIDGCSGPTFHPHHPQGHMLMTGDGALSSPSPSIAASSTSNHHHSGMMSPEDEAAVSALAEQMLDAQELFTREEEPKFDRNGSEEVSVDSSVC